MDDWVVKANLPPYFSIISHYLLLYIPIDHYIRSAILSD